MHKVVHMRSMWWCHTQQAAFVRVTHSVFCNPVQKSPKMLSNRCLITFLLEHTLPVPIFIHLILSMITCIIRGRLFSFSLSFRWKKLRKRPVVFQKSSCLSSFFIFHILCHLSSPISLFLPTYELDWIECVQLNVPQWLRCEVGSPVSKLKSFRLCYPGFDSLTQPAETGLWWDAGLQLSYRNHIHAVSP